MGRLTSLYTCIDVKFGVFVPNGMYKGKKFAYGTRYHAEQAWGALIRREPNRFIIWELKLPAKEDVLKVLNNGNEL